MNQVDWEHSLVRDRLADKRFSIRRSLSSGHATETAFGQTILNQQLVDLSKAIKVLAERKTRGLGGAYSQILVKAATEFNADGDYTQNYMKVAFIGLTTVLEEVYHQEKKRSFSSHIAYKIGKALEEEHTLYMFSKTNKEKLHLHRHRAMREERSAKETAKRLAYRVQKDWADNPLDQWGKKARVQVGMRVLRAVLTTLSEYLVLKKIQQATRHEMVVVPTTALNEFLAEHTEYVLSTTRTSHPCIEPPLPWVADDDVIVGGFHTIDCSQNRQFIQTKSAEQREWISKSPPLQHIEVANALQNVGWNVRTDVLDFIKHAIQLGILPKDIPHIEPPVFPPKPESAEDYTQWKRDRYALVKLNKQRVSRLGVLRHVLSMAERLRDKTFYFVYTCDFRGRLYPASGSLNPQGAPYVRALLQFAEGKPLGQDGLYWLAIHGANTYGNGRESYTDRYQWVLDNEERIRAVASKPDSSRGRSALTGASDPLNFFAFCREYTAAIDSGNPEAFVSHLPVSLDGSANGIQHYSALLRDQDGARDVNLTASTSPQDIYGVVATQLTRVLSTDTTDKVSADIILKGGVDRNLVKGPVMTMPYGVTLRGISLDLCHYLDDHADQYDLQEGSLKNWSVIVYLTEKIIEVINAEVKAPSVCMQWLHDVAMSVGAEEVSLKWLSPVGFPVCHPYRRYNESLVHTQLMGAKKIYFRDKVIGVDKTKAKVSLAPNFIHSMDASHLVMTIQELTAQGVNSITCVHDCIGTHACDVPVMQRALRHSMYDLYATDQLELFRQQMLQLIGRVSPVPEYGTYDIRDVLNSEYLFN